MRIECRESLQALREMPAESVDALITDPPYSSGGLYRGDRNQKTSDKYVGSDVARTYAEFSGDSRDQRSWTAWCEIWLAETYRVLRQGSKVLVFADWRMLPSLTDAIQAAGFVLRGIAAWDKGDGARAPHKGYLRHQCEFIAWGSKGPMPIDEHGGPYPGCFRETVKQNDKHHMTGKPTRLMRDLVRIVPPGGVVLDPFMGSGTTGVACVAEGRDFIGFEREQPIFAVAERRIREAQTPSDPTGALAQPQRTLFEEADPCST